ncbi:MAG TPA: hypothetical protein VFN78_11800 [Ktedonobacterales bacterium]|nr:hypothetical protein [Ktedonobacterales bacterium]
MAASGYGYSRPNGRGDTIATALIAYGQHGGALYAAYRSPDNPLAPSHLRWQGQNGEAIEAEHEPDHAYDLPQEEREAWAQIALSSTSNQADAVGPQAPWLLVALDRQRALELGMRAQRARVASAPPLTPNSMPPLSGAPGGYSNAPYGGSPYGAPPAPQMPPRMQPMQPMQPYQGQSPNPRSDEYMPTRLIDALPASSPSAPDQAQSTGSWRRDELLRGAPSYGPGQAQGQPEVSAIPCIEVEMPMLLSPEQTDFTRDFARDVAMHFSRAARAIPQARELRGWMRGARIVLAVRMGFGPGARSATRPEMEHAAGLLADALARRTLPYAQLRFADMAEWNQGVELPE